MPSTRPPQIASIIAVVTDALTRRLMEFAVDELGAPPCPCPGWRSGAWDAVRSCPHPTSTLRSSGMADGEDEQERYMQALGPAWWAS